MEMRTIIVLCSVSTRNKVKCLPTDRAQHFSGIQLCPHLLGVMAWGIKQQLCYEKVTVTVLKPAVITHGLKKSS